MNDTERLIRVLERKSAKASPTNRLWRGSSLACAHPRGEGGELFGMRLNPADFAQVYEMQDAPSQLLLSFPQERSTALDEHASAFGDQFDRFLRSFLPRAAVEIATHVVAWRQSELRRENAELRQRVTALENTVAAILASAPHAEVQSAPALNFAADVSLALSAAREVGDELNWRVEWRVVEGEPKIDICADSDAADHIGESMLEFYARLASRIPARIFHSIEFDLDIRDPEE